MAGVSFTQEELKDLKKRRDFVVANSADDVRKCYREIAKWALICLAHSVIAGLFIVRLTQGHTFFYGEVEVLFIVANIVFGILAVTMLAAVISLLRLIKQSQKLVKVFDEEYGELAYKAEINAAFRQ